MEIRNISHELCFVTEEKIGQDFHKIIVDLIKKNKNLQINFTNLVDLVHVDASFQIHIYRILQEAFNNISRHSLDRSGRLSFEMIDDELVITIENEVARRQGEIKKSGIGLRNIDARVTAMNARLKVQISGQFFRIKINVPKIV
ncbi:MAG: GHKL domain-containing protein [Sphingobacteriales bacterium]|nr:MAG: GHKL domain-containing protein [Sphingobacteriales bacterium]